MKKLPKLQRGVGALPDPDIHELRRVLEADGVVVYVIPSAGITDQASFFKAAEAALPLDPPEIGAGGWDAFSDSLWNGIDELEAERVAILWPNGRAVAQAVAPELDLVFAVFDDVATALVENEGSSGGSKELSVLVGG